MESLDLQVQPGPLVAQATKVTQAIKVTRAQPAILVPKATLVHSVTPVQLDQPEKSESLAEMVKTRVQLDGRA
jgi:hypothetical protein